MRRRMLALVLALSILAGCGVDEGMKARLADPQIIAELARQESARADKMQAEAAGALAQAEKTQAEAAAAGAWSQSESQLAGEWAKRWPWLVIMMLAAGGLAMFGGAAAWTRWAWLRSGMQPLPGGLVSLAAGSRAVIIDPVRGLVGGVLAIDAGGVPKPILATSEELAADVARAALVAEAVKHVGGSESRAEIAARVTGSLSEAFAHLAGAVAAPRQWAAVPASPTLRLVKLRSPEAKKKAEAASDAAELREFVEVGSTVGFQRRQWAGYKFKATGRSCSQTRWSIMAGWLKDSELLDGPALVVPAAEALQRLGFEAHPDESG